MNQELKAAILNLWSISRTALAGMSVVPSRYDRMIYVRDQLKKDHADLIARLSPKHLWFAIEEATEPTTPIY